MEYFRRKGFMSFSEKSGMLFEYLLRGPCYPVKSLHIYLKTDDPNLSRIILNLYWKAFFE